MITGIGIASAPPVVNAGIGGEALVVAFALALFAIHWVVEQMKAAARSAGQSGPRENDPIRPRTAAGSGSEEERMRKFMEALGLPAEAAHTRPDSEATTLRPAGTTVAPRRPPVLPFPPKVAVPPMPRPPTLQTPRFPPQLPRSVPVESASARSLDEEPAPVLPVEKIHLAPLETPEVPDFHTLSSVVTAIPFEGVAATAESASLPVENVAVAGARLLLRSPSAMRSAVLLHEILGPPRGLQSGIGPHSFPAR